MNNLLENRRESHTEIGEKLAGKFLTFALNNEEYAIEILTVNQIIRLQEITEIPRMPPFIRGIINLRGMIIPIIDLHNKFNIKEHTDTDRTCIVVIQIEQHKKKINMGIVIDEVREVIEIRADDIEQTPEFGAGINTEFILGIAKTGKRVKIILDIKKVLTFSEIELVTSFTKRQNN